MMTPTDLWYLIANTRNTVAKRTYARQPNWVLVRDMFGCGSTKAHEICHTARLDPAAKSMVALGPELPPSTKSATGE